MFEENQNQVEERKPENKEDGKNSYHNFWFHLVLFICGYVGLILITIFIELILKAANPLYLDPTSEFYIQGLSIVNNVRYALLALILIVLIIPHISDLLKSFKNFRNIGFGLVMGAVAILSTILYNAIASNFVQIEKNINEETAESLIKLYPVISIFIVGIIGPFCEELTYRYGLFEFINKKSKILAYIIAILVFAFVHMDFSGDISTEFLNLPSYIIAGTVLTIAFDKFGFAGSFIAHVVNNMYAIIITLIMK